MQYVVFGSDGYIGSYIYNQLLKDGYNTIGTSRRLKTEDALVYYDIQQNNIDCILSEICDNAKTAIICIAESNIDRCFENYALAYEINVCLTRRLIKQLVDNDFHIIYFSSDNVFDGISGNYTEESPTHPINKYGIMKDEMEKYLLKTYPEVCILRISKVVSTFERAHNVFTEWVNQVRTGRINCIKGNKLSFVCIDDVYHACLISSEKNLCGIYNVVGDCTYSRAELARKFLNYSGMATIELNECNLDELFFKDRRPLNLGMSNQKFKNITGYQFMDMDSVIKQYLQNSIKKE